MSRLAFKGFVLDECAFAPDLVASFPDGLVVGFTEIGLEAGKRVPDATVLRHARTHERIIISRNGWDFVRYMSEASGTCESASECFCGVGLVSVTPGVERIFYGKLTRNLSFNGVEIGWGDVFICNLDVRVRPDGFEVVRRAVCRHFLQDHADCEPCQRLGIVPTLA